MAYYRFPGLSLEIRQNSVKSCDLTDFLEGLSWICAAGQVKKPSLVVTIEEAEGRRKNLPSAREVLSIDGFRCLEDGKRFVLTDDASWFHLETSRGHGQAWLDQSFHDKPAILQSSFWSFGLLKLLRHKGLFNLHSAGLVDPSGHGMLIISDSGAGKSTLALGLIRLGWGYLSDDAQLLRRGATDIEALALRRAFFVDSDTSHMYPDIPLGAILPDKSGGLRREIGVKTKWPKQFVARCVPRILIFPEIVSSATSALSRLDKAVALGKLLRQSGPQLFDQAFMPQQLAVLNQLMQQCSLFELKAGRDIHHNAEKFVQLLHEVKGKG